MLRDRSIYITAVAHAVVFLEWNNNNTLPRNHQRVALAPRHLLEEGRGRDYAEQRSHSAMPSVPLLES